MNKEQNIQQKQAESFSFGISEYIHRNPKRLNSDETIDMYLEEYLLLFLTNILLDIPVIILTDEEIENGTGSFARDMRLFLKEKISMANIPYKEKAFLKRLLELEATTFLEDSIETYNKLHIDNKVYLELLKRSKNLSIRNI